MQRTYTPGYLPAKALLVLVGLGCVALGLWQGGEPLGAEIHGVHALGVIQRIEKIRDGKVIDVYTSSQSIPRDETQGTAFTYYIQYAGPGGTPQSGLLAVRNQYEPKYTIGDTLTLSYAEGGKGPLFASYDWSTWALPAFLIACGLAFSGAFLQLLIFAPKPIPIPDDTP